MREHGLAHDDLRVDGVWSTAGNRRVGRIELTCTPSIWLTREDHVAMPESVQASTVTNTPREPPVVDIAMPRMRAACD